MLLGWKEKLKMKKTIKIIEVKGETYTIEARVWKEN